MRSNKGQNIKNMFNFQKVIIKFAVNCVMVKPCEI